LPHIIFWGKGKVASYFGESCLPPLQVACPKQHPFGEGGVGNLEGKGIWKVTLRITQKGKVAFGFLVT